MTTAELLRILRSRWYVLLVGLGIVAAVFTVSSQAAGAYSASSSVVFVSSGNEVLGEVDEQYLESLVGFTAVVERQFHDGRGSDRLGEKAPLFGTGVNQGSRVLLVNSGTLWENSFAKPVISVDVVGPSPAWVTSTLASITSRLDRISKSEQAKLGIPPDKMIFAAQVPAAIQIHQVGSTADSRLRALSALTIVGFGVSCAAAVLLDRIISRRSRARTITRWPYMAALKEGNTP